MRVGIHQPGLAPWFPFFYKMAMCDVFVLLTDVQFEKNGFQNRYKTDEGWVTKPVKSGLCKIRHKKYADGTDLVRLNTSIIRNMADILGIKTRIRDDQNSRGQYSYKSGTERLIDIIKDVQDSDRTCRGRKFDKRDMIYVTNPTAKDKYLDEELINSHGIGIEYCKVPRNLNRHTFEMLEEFGLEGTAKQLPKHIVDEGHPKVNAFDEEFQSLHNIAMNHGTEIREYKDAVA